MGVVAVDGGYPKSIHVYSMQLFLQHYNLRIDPNLQVILAVLVTVTFKRKWNSQLRQIMKITNGGKRGSAQLLQIYSREVGQPYITIVGITLRAVVHALWLMIPVRTQVVYFSFTF
ncbi:hypothetical protein NC652_030504 [Populus alba x Populus x berolinensis]|nr:hypothetical protein NC652_030504 [Populus alba x Populus x berolinensis]